MKKKGFTLIELLAVIIILAIIALIATPIILNVIDDARKSAGLSESEMIMSSINNYCATSAMKSQLDGSVDICNDEDGITKEDVENMVQLGNAKVLDVVYKNDKLLWLQVESNNNTYSYKKCVDAINQTDSEGNLISEICTDSTNGSIINGTSTYTHPAFTFGDEELTGFWVESLK